jgi:DNA mismatch repair ATPase MutS
MDAEENDGDISYRYTISKGISEIQGAVKVLRDMKYPEEIIQTIIDYDDIKIEVSDADSDAVSTTTS